MNPLVVPHDPQWNALYIHEQSALERLLGSHAISIHHIGSTSIPDILAKPIIDILIEADSLELVDQCSAEMQALGYEVMGEFGIESRRYFRKTNHHGVRTHHVHTFAVGSPHLDRHLAFRDYLRAHPSLAQAYSSLKADLVKRDHATLEEYIEGKNPFIKETEQQALTWYRARR